MKKKVHIISHSHWDREWYMSYEQHHMRLVELLDDLLELFETDPDFDSLHLDGQTIILDDYLEVRPDKKEAIEQAIKAGKLKIGPFYILQDDFLISSEANVRNMLIGMKESKKWGTPVMLGYFPDTFGNMGQTPQMMKQAGLSAAAFGRGVKPVGFNNEVLSNENYSSQYSEMWWEGPDKSQIFGLLFANWYSNGNEIPTEKEEALVFWKQKLKDVEAFASTNHLLMMNGVDHQPVQKDVTKALRLANELFPEYEFVHSNFTAYIQAVQEALPKDVGRVHGELTSQETDGWFTLANTASARVYLKQWNTKVQRQLENIAEPLAAMAYDVTGKYPHDQLDYAWKLLLQNHPHDSICGCSVDEVHREMVTRFEKAHEVGKYLSEESLQQLKSVISTDVFPQNAKPFIIFNTSGYLKSGVVTLDVELERKLFKEGAPDKLWEELAGDSLSKLQIVDAKGMFVEGTISEPKVRFDYDLPKDRFRVPYMVKYVSVELSVEKMAAFSWATLALVEDSGTRKKPNTMLSEDGYLLENDCLIVKVKENGSLSVFNKETQMTYEDLLIFEDTGDIGNEYIFKQPEGTEPILSTTNKAAVKIVKDKPYLAEIKITHRLWIPESADNTLKLEQESVVDFRYRKAKRSQQLKELTIETVVSMEQKSSRLRVVTSLENQMEDHRLRVLFPTNIFSETHEADSIYEVVTRLNKVGKDWENPTNPQHQQAFVNVHDASQGITISNYGLNEYEVLPENTTIALTLFRAVGEMGDWGYFPTPEAQCLGPQVFNYGLDFHGKRGTRFETYKRAYGDQIPFVTTQTTIKKGTFLNQDSYLKIDGATFAVTALKNSEATEQLVLRGFNLADFSAEVVVEKNGTESKTVLLNLLEEKQTDRVQNELSPYEIRTIGFDRGK